jgi:type VI secretion system secreted protein VgrG
MGMPAARIGDMHVCPMVTGVVPHVGGPVLPPCAITVLTGSIPQARVGDMCTCVGPPDVIVVGAFTVLVSGSPAARMLDTTAHGGKIIIGLPTVLIGDSGGGGGGGGGGGAGAAGSSSAKSLSKGSASGAAKIGKDTEKGTYGKSIVIEGDEAYQKKVRRDLDQIATTPSGKKLLADLERSNKKITIRPTTKGNSVSLPKGSSDWQRKSDGTNGAGSDSTVNYNPENRSIGTQDWQTRPPAIGLAHELIHAQHAAEGSIDLRRVANDSKPSPTNPGTFATEKLEEVRTAGIPPHDKGGYTENSIRSEWNPKQPERKWY